MTFGTHLHPKRMARRSLALTLAATLLLPSGATLLLPMAAAAQAGSTAADLSSVQMPTVPAATGPIQTILMFPFTSKVASGADGGFDAPIIGARVENAIKQRLNVIGRYKANSFSPMLPQIQRAVQDSGIAGITETDVAPPYDSSQKGRRLADQVATDGFLLGTIESIQTDAQTRTVSLTITATLYNTQTGQAVKALAYTGRGVSFNASDSPDMLLQSAINDAAGHVVSALNADTAQGRPMVVRDVRQKHKSGIGPVVLGVLVAAAIAIGITASHHHHNNGSSSSGGTTTPPVTTPPVTPGGPPAPPL